MSQRISYIEYLNGDISGYGSHLKPMEFIFENIPRPKMALELGMGFFSTPYLLDNCDNVFSIEMQSEEWYNKVKDQFKNRTNWGSLLTNKITKFIYITEQGAYAGNNNQIMLLRELDFVLVDGSAITRSVAVGYYMERDVETIILHDTETSWYGYNTINEYQEKFGYYMYEFRWEAPWTRVYTKNKNLIWKLKTL